MSNPNLNRDSDGRFRSKATWKEEVLEILLKDQARRSVSDAEYTKLLDDDAKSWGVTPYESKGYWNHGRAVAVWAEYIAKAHRDGTGEDSCLTCHNQGEWYGCPECKRTRSQKEQR